MRPALLAALMLAGCATPEERAARDVDEAVQNATDAMNAAAAEMQAEAAAGAAADAANEAMAVTNAVEAAADAAANAVAAVIADEFVEVARNCKLPSARLIRNGDHYDLGLPPEIYAVRGRDPVHGRMLCITHWGLEIGEDFEIVEAR